MDSWSSLAAALNGAKNTMRLGTRHRFPRQTGQLNWKQMARLGFTWVEEIDHWFLRVTFPVGWYKEREREYLGWSLVYDEQDRPRCQCMEGHNAYDGVFANWLRRYNYDLQWQPGVPTHLRWVISDGGDILHASEWVTTQPPAEALVGRHMVHQAYTFLNEKYPQWRRLDAYW